VCSLSDDCLDAREAVLLVCGRRPLAFFADCSTGGIIFKVARHPFMFHMRNVKTRLSCSLNVPCPVFPTSERHTEMSLIVSSYYYRSKYDHETFYAQLRNHTNFDIISNAHEEEGYPIPDGLHAVGYMPQQEYDLFLVNSYTVSSAIP
jgi:hypothetical protein